MLAALALLACSDYAVNPHKDEVFFDSGDTVVTPGDTGGDTATTQPPEEVCNGIDDDGDDAIDEGFGDADGDGTADCVDDACDVDMPPADTISTSDACDGGGSVGDPWDIGVEWQWTGLSSDPTYAQVIVTPVVGELTDDDADGDVDTDDVPDVVVVAYVDDPGNDAARAVALSGDDGHELWEYSSRLLDGFANPVVADVNADGENDVLVFSAFSDGNHLVLLDREGNEEWVSPSLPFTIGLVPTVADLDGDGRPEIIAYDQIFDGVTGTLVTTLWGVSDGYWSPTVSDLDGDGQPEILVAGRVYASDGTLLWTAPSSSVGVWHAAVADLDGDPTTGEVLWVAGKNAYIYTADGTQLAHMSFDHWYPGAPTIADLDGDGAPEIAFPEQLTMRAFEADGTPMWSVPVSDTSSVAGASAFDFDGDGAYEVVYADESTLWILDGATGAVRWSDPDHASGTWFEYPIVSDVDHDGSAEIVLASNDIYSSTGGWAGVTVLGQADDAWPSVGGAWPTHDYVPTNIDADGTVPASPTPGWAADNVFRARPGGEGVRTDLVVSIADVCAASCDAGGAVAVSVQVGNRGLVDLPAGVVVTLSRDDAGVLTPIATQTLSEPLPSATRSAALVFEITADEIGADGLVASVAPPSGVRECDPSNDSAAWTDLPCP